MKKARRLNGGPSAEPTGDLVGSGCRESGPPEGGPERDRRNGKAAAGGNQRLTR